MPILFIYFIQKGDVNLSRDIDLQNNEAFLPNRPWHVARGYD